MKPLSIATLSTLSSLRTPQEKQEKQGENATGESDPSADAFAEFMNVPGDSPAMPPASGQAPGALRVLRWADSSAQDDAALAAGAEGSLAQGTPERDFAHSASALTSSETVLNWRKSLREMIEGEGLGAEAAVPTKSPEALSVSQPIEAEPAPAAEMHERDTPQRAETSAAPEPDATAVAALAGLGQSHMDVAPQPEVEAPVPDSAAAAPLTPGAEAPGRLSAMVQPAVAEPQIRNAARFGLQAGAAPLPEAKTSEITPDLEPREPPQLAPTGQVPPERPVAQPQMAEASLAVADEPPDLRATARVESAATSVMVADASQDRPMSREFISPEQGAGGAPMAAAPADAPEVAPQALPQPLDVATAEAADQGGQPEESPAAVSAPVVAAGELDLENGARQAEEATAPSTINGASEVEEVSGKVSEPVPDPSLEDASAPKKGAAPTDAADSAAQAVTPREPIPLASPPGLAAEGAVSEKPAESGVQGSAVASPSHRTGASQGLGPQVAEALVNAPNRGVELTLAPEELGKVRMTLHAQEGSMSVTVQAERPETLDLMRRHIDSLAREFREMGYADVSFDFGQQSSPQRQPQEPLAEAPRAPEPAPAGPIQSADAIAPAEPAGGAAGLDLRM